MGCYVCEQWMNDMDSPTLKNAGQWKCNVRSLCLLLMDTNKNFFFTPPLCINDVYFMQNKKTKKRFFLVDKKVFINQNDFFLTQKKTMKNKQKKLKNSNWKIAIWSGQSLLIPWFELIRRQTNNDDDDDDDQLDWFVFFYSFRKK